MLFVNHRSAAGTGENDTSSDRPNSAKRQHTGVVQPSHAAAAASTFSRAGSTAAAASAAASSDAPHPSGSAAMHEPTDYPEHDGEAPMVIDDK